MAMNEARHKVSQLETAIKRVDSIKKHLNRNASDIKTEIHANVSRHLESLRGREVSLLSQVDQVLGVKEETLQQQQARLNQALGVLQTGLSMVQDDTASEKQLADTLEKLNNIELSPEETPYISFRADNVNLRETILNYGRVDANGLPLITAFDDPGNPSASLPRHIEEYEDVDHHVFYKTVEEVKRAKTSASSIHVTIPKLSNRVEDWLQKKSSNLAPKSAGGDSPAKHLPATRPSTLTKSGDTPALSLSRTSTPGSSCSLNNWLSHIKQQSDLEEEHDFEIIDNSLSQKGLTDPKQSLASSRLSGDLLCPVKQDLKEWLHSDSVSPGKFTSDIFKHIPADTKLWLLQACKQLTSLDDLQHQDFFRHVSKEPSTWLRSRAHSKQYGNSQEGKDGHDFFSHITKNNEFWLMKQNGGPVDMTRDQTPGYMEPGRSKREDEAEWLMRSTNTAVVQLEDICRANELCCGMSECVSQPDCLAMHYLQQAPNMNEVDPGQAFKPLALSVQDWLALSSKKQEDKAHPSVNKSSLDLFRHIPDARDFTQWLIAPACGSPASNSQVPSSLAKFKDNKEETNQWLKRSNSSGLADSPLSADTGRSGSTCVDYCISDWLLVQAEGDEKIKDGNDKEKEESEGWSICSDTHSISTEQHAKDVAIATEYLNSWLL